MDALSAVAVISPMPAARCRRWLHPSRAANSRSALHRVFGRDDLFQHPGQHCTQGHRQGVVAIFQCRECGRPDLAGADGNHAPELAQRSAAQVDRRSAVRLVVFAQAMQASGCPVAPVS